MVLSIIPEAGPHIVHDSHIAQVGGRVGGFEFSLAIHPDHCATVLEAAIVLQKMANQAATVLPRQRHHAHGIVAVDNVQIPGQVLFGTQ